MLEDLEKLRPGDRPRSIPMWTIAAPHLRRWRTARWFVALLVPVMAAVITSIVRGQQPIVSICVALIGAGTAFGIFAELSTGVGSSNWGTYFRKREPVWFWLGVVPIVVGYLFICAIGLALNANSQIAPAL